MKCKVGVSAVTTSNERGGGDFSVKGMTGYHGSPALERKGHVPLHLLGKPDN